MRGLLSLFCLTVLLGSTSAQDQNLYPLKKGSKWTFKSTTDTVEVTVKDVKKGDKDKEDVYELETRVGGTPVAAEHIAVRMDGVYRVKVGGVDVKPPMPFLKFPAKKGESWTVSSAVGPEKLEGKFTIGETMVEWNNEKKAAITVSGPEMTANGQKLTLSYTFLEGVGLFSQSMTLAGVTAKLDLTKYEPAKE